MRLKLCKFRRGVEDFRNFVAFSGRSRYDERLQVGPATAAYPSSDSP